MPNLVSVNFEGVESGVQQVHVPEGDYGLKITKVVQKVGEESQKPYLLFSLKITSGHKGGIGKTVPHTCSLSKNALWNFRNLLEATGKTIPAKAIKIDLDKLTGLTLAGSVVDDEYKGKPKSVFAAFFPLADLNAEKESDKEEADDLEGTSPETETEEAVDEEADELFD